MSAETFHDNSGHKVPEEGDVFVASTETRTPSVKELDEMFAIPSPETTEAYPPLSTAAEFVQRGAARVVSFLERRALNATHNEALKEYRQRSPEDYTDHLAALSEEVDQEGNPTRGQEFGQKQLDRENRRADRAERLERGRKGLRKIGLTAVMVAAAPVVVTLGVGVMAGSAAASGAKKGAQAIHQKAGERWEARQAQREEARNEKEAAKLVAQQEKEWERDQKARAQAEARQAQQMEEELARQEKEARLRERAEAAYRRRKERREKWAARKERVAGAYNTTQEFRRRQQKRVGTFVLRAHAAGQGAVEGWRNFDTGEK